MTGTRIDFLSVDAARFNHLRDRWRSVASSCALSKAGLRVATVLPGFVSREFGYAFPTDEDLSSAIGASNPSTAKRGLVSLEGADLIERKTMVKRDGKGEAIGRIRRIHLTLPQVKVQEVKVQPEVKVQKRGGEGSPVCTNIRDRITPDNEIRHERKVSSYVPAREGWPKGYEEDTNFLDDFDRFLMAATDSKPIGAGEIEQIVQKAFDAATDSSDLFMPFHWRDVLALRSGQTAQWFLRRAGQLIHRSAAA